MKRRLVALLAASLLVEMASTHKAEDAMDQKKVDELLMTAAELKLKEQEKVRNQQLAEERAIREAKDWRVRL